MSPPHPLHAAAGALPLLENLSLFLDLDGTLAALESAPAVVGPMPRRSALLRRAVDRLDGRLAIVSGRNVAEVDRILDGAVTPVAGLHGLERRSANGDMTATPLHPALMAAKTELEALAWSTPGLEVEDKGLSLALHFRRAPHARTAARALVSDLARRTGMVFQAGDCVAELRPAGPDKGEAVLAFLREPPFVGSVPVFVGDDLTDEDGFRAVQAAGGVGVLVGAPRATLATFGLSGVPAVLDWLEADLQPA